jgi:cytochrome c556
MRMFFGAIAVASLALSTAASDAPEAVVKYRQSVMKAMAAHMTAASLIVKKQAGTRARLAAHADAIHALSDDLQSLFPASSGPEKVKTASLPAVWQRQQDFGTAAASLRNESAKLATLARHGDEHALAAQFDAVAAACSSCHKTFRARDSD